MSALPDIHPRDEDTPVAATLLSVKAVYSSFRPAQRFWNSFQIYDPAVVFAVRIRSARVAVRFESDLRLLLDSKPAEWSDLWEKRKAATCIGLSKVVVDVARASTPDLEAISELKRALVSYLLTDAVAFAPGEGDQPRSSDRWVSYRADSSKNPDPVLVHQLIDMAGEHWVEALRNDAQAFGARSPTGWPGS